MSSRGGYRFLLPLIRQEEMELNASGVLSLLLERIWQFIDFSKFQDMSASQRFEVVVLVLDASIELTSDLVYVQCQDLKSIFFLKRPWDV